jgi:hypothetical protein
MWDYKKCHIIFFLYWGKYYESFHPPKLKHDKDHLAISLLLGKAWLGKARLGKAWLGKARLGKAWLG